MDLHRPRHALKQQGQRVGKDDVGPLVAGLRVHSLLQVLLARLNQLGAQVLGEVLHNIGPFKKNNT